MKALEVLRDYRNSGFILPNSVFQNRIDDAIKELEENIKTINTSIEEIEYALAKPYYAEVYLNNAIRFLKELK